jgi:hypothetical protein
MLDYERMGSRRAYNDTCFDSLTEARWATYFDSVGIPYIYEPETFEMMVEGPKLKNYQFSPELKMYTPDFFLPDQDVYVEIKRGNAWDGTALKLGKVALALGKPGMLIDGRPGNFGMYVFSPNPDDSPTRPVAGMGFECNFIETHHTTLPSEEREPELRAKIIKLCWDIFDRRYPAPTAEQLHEKMEHKKANRRNMTFLNIEPKLED